jgi:ribose transport system substrate-binding protein
MLDRRSACAFAASALLALGLAACGGGGDGDGTAGGTTSTSANTAATAFKVPDSGCGSFATPPPSDPVVAQFTDEQKQAIAGYTNFPESTLKIVDSAWKDWKPNHAPPYTVAISWGQLVSDFNVQATRLMEEDLRKDPDIGDVIVKNTGNNLDVAQQLQQYNQIVQQKPDVILLQTPSADSFIGPVNKAAAQGIPTVTLLSTVNSDKAVNVDGNTYQGAGWAASFVAQQLKGQGNVLQVNALAGSPPDLSSLAAWKEVYKNCPGLKSIGDVYGGFSDNLAKSETLKFLATHPQKIDAALEVAVMAPGVMRAFQQTGRPMPIVPDVGLSKGSLGYWNQNKADYSNVATSLPPLPAAAATAEVARRMLHGQGVKYNAIIGKQPLVDDTNLSEWVEGSWNLNTPGAALGTRDSFLPSSFLATFFNQPADLATK